MTAAQTALWALVVVPAGVGGLMLLAPRRLAEPVAGGVAVGAALVATALAVLAAVARPAVAVPFVAGSDLGLAVDGLAAVVAPTVAVVAALVLVGAAGDGRGSRARFAGLMLLFTAAALLTVTATTLPTLLLGWEVMGAMSFALVGFRWHEAHRVTSGLTAFLTTRTTDLGLYVAAGAAFGGSLAAGARGADGLHLDALAALAPGWRDVVAAGILVAALGKAAQLVTAFWLSRAMDGPSPVSALLHSAAMVAMGGYLLLRVVPLLAATSWAGPVTAWAGALTTVGLGLVALGQTDLKQLLAASTSAQLGFVVLAAGVGAPAAGTAHLVAHAATKAALFLAAGAWLTALGTKRLAGLRGTTGTWPLVRGGATVALLALAGVPPLSLWATKDLVLAATLERSAPLAVVAVVGAALSAAYAGVALRVLWAPVDDDEARAAAATVGDEEEPTGAVPRSLTGATVVLATAAALLGILAVPAVSARLATVVGGPLVTPGPAEALGSALIALLVVALVWRYPVRLGSWAASWGGLEAATHRVLVQPVLGLAGLLDTADRGLAGVVDRSAAATRAVAARTAATDDRWVHGAVVSLAAAVRRAGSAARRPQTGQLHQYYVQAVALVALGTVLLVVVR